MMLLAARAFGAARWLKPCRAVLPLATARLHTSQPLVLGFPSSSRNTRQPRLAAGALLLPSWPAGARFLCPVSKAGPVVAGPPRAAPMSTAADTGAVVVYVTVPNREVGRQIANSLVENKLAACVNIIPGVLAALTGW